MSAPVALRASYSDLYGSSMLPVLEEIFRSVMARHPMRRDLLGRIVSTSRDIYQSSELHDIDLFNQVAEGEEFSFRRSKQGANKTLSILKWGLGFSISEEAVDDGRIDMIADMVAKLAKSGMETQEINFMNLLNNGFGSETTADGQPLFDTAHTLPSGLTFRNELSTSADLSVTSLDTALVDFETQQIGDSGIIYSLRPKFLVVAPQGKRQAMEITKSILKADTADNNMNSFLDDNLQVVSSPHLTDTDSWYLLSEPAEHGLRVVVRKPLETRAGGADLGFTTDSIQYKARFREVIGAIHAYGSYGSPGA